jgi:uncharacterized SAM-binding protein YcdF (DUF218 family)
VIRLLALRMLLLPLVVVTTWVAIAVALFVVHHDDPPARADAVVVLAGTSQRLPVGLRLMREGEAPLLVVSRPDKPNALYRRVCGGGTRFTVVCFRASPYSTRGEAREIGRLARTHHWQSVDVVTSYFHDFRARIVVARCYHGRLAMIGAPQQTWKLPWYMLTESAKLVYQLLVARGC